MTENIYLFILNVNVLMVCFFFSEIIFYTNKKKTKIKKKNYKNSIVRGIVSEY